MEGWHFLCEDRRLAHGDGRLVVPGETLAVKGPPILGQWGLHVAERAVVALRHASGLMICRDRLGCAVVRSGGLAAGTERTCLWMADATSAVQNWLIWRARRRLEAERAIGCEPDARSWAGLDAAEAYLRGEMSLEALEKAIAAARTAAWNARDAAETVRDATQAARVAVLVAWATDDKMNVDLERRLWALKPGGGHDA